AAYKSFASRLPARLSELSGASQYAFQAILDAFASTADVTLLDIIAKMAECDQTKGWWEEEIASSLAHVARRGDCGLQMWRDGRVIHTREVKVLTIANILFENPSLAVCKRLLVPLLRYSTSSFCEQFFSNIVSKLLATLSKRSRGESDSYELRKMLREQARCYTLVTMAFEKIPLASLKSEESILYQRVEKCLLQPSLLMKRACGLCVASRDKACPRPAAPQLKEAYR
ncbi:uncharacterized protein LOC114361835, partial [Ostrinia furnacalis]|uniref:uncharacterized protein LOC114361835 n=1 Tax=Ostrinia furnacalis TaxID=93504 RepID=UPI00103B14DA